MQLTVQRANSFALMAYSVDRSCCYEIQCIWAQYIFTSGSHQKYCSQQNPRILLVSLRLELLCIPIDIHHLTSHEGLSISLLLCSHLPPKHYPPLLNPHIYTMTSFMLSCTLKVDCIIFSHSISPHCLFHPPPPIIVMYPTPGYISYLFFFDFVFANFSINSSSSSSAASLLLPPLLLSALSLSFSFCCALRCFFSALASCFANSAS